MTESNAMEQQYDGKAKAWFDDLLSDQLVFRCASRAVVDKRAFLKSLDETNAFTSHRSDEISVTVLGEGTLATLISHTTNLDGTYHFYRNIRLFSKQGQDWKLKLWYNCDLTSLWKRKGDRLDFSE